MNTKDIPLLAIVSILSMLALGMAIALNAIAVAVVFSLILFICICITLSRFMDSCKKNIEEEED